jgi:Uma2 family endonuclease
MATVTRLLTADDLWMLPDDGQRHELVRGELRTMPPPGFEHGLIVANLLGPLMMHVQANDLGVVVGNDTGFLIARDPDSVRGPDLGFVTRERIAQSGIPKKYYPGAPDLAVEVLSPSDTVFAVDEKVQDWLDAGTRLVWVVNPRRRTVTINTASARPAILTDSDTLEGHDVVPGFRIAVARLFATP